MQAKTFNTSIEPKLKNQLFKKKVIMNYNDLKEKLSSIFESESEKTGQNNHYSKMLIALFDVNKFKIRNDFDRKHCKEFLKEKDKYLQPLNLDDSLSDDDEEIGAINRISSKFTFGRR